MTCGLEESSELVLDVELPSFVLSALHSGHKARALLVVGVCYDFDSLFATETDRLEGRGKHLVVKAFFVVTAVSQELFVNGVELLIAVGPMAVQASDGTFEGFQVDLVKATEGLEVSESRVEVGELLTDEVLQLSDENRLRIKDLKGTNPVFPRQMGLLVRIQLGEQFEQHIFTHLEAVQGVLLVHKRDELGEVDLLIHLTSIKCTGYRTIVLRERHGNLLDRSMLPVEVRDLGQSSSHGVEELVFGVATRRGKERTLIVLYDPLEVRGLQ